MTGKHSRDGRRAAVSSVSPGQFHEPPASTFTIACRAWLVVCNLVTTGGAMSTETPAQLTRIQPSPPKKSQHRVLKVVGAVVAAGALIGIGAAIGSSGNSTKTVTVPRPTITQTVPGPNVTQQVTVSPPPPATGTTIATFRGSGNENTGSFNVPDSGNYLVAWSYRRNNECSLGSCQATNFSISETGSGLGGDLPNDIAASGHGSTEVTGVSGTDRFNVQAVGSWTITVKAA